MTIKVLALTSTPVEAEPSPRSAAAINELDSAMHSLQVHVDPDSSAMIASMQKNPSTSKGLQKRLSLEVYNFTCYFCFVVSLECIGNQPMWG